jgi:hypothetical protein
MFLAEDIAVSDEAIDIKTLHPVGQGLQFLGTNPASSTGTWAAQAAPKLSAITLETT